MSLRQFSGSRRHFGLSAVAGAVALVTISGGAQAQTAKSYFEFKKPKMIAIDGDLSLDTNGKAAPVSNIGSPYVFGFEGVSQYNGASFGRNFVPPDTMGAVGGTQYVETSNGAYAVFDKGTGAQLSLQSDVAFWAAAGQTGANGDTRIMYNAAANRWVAVAFGANTKDLQIAVSNTDNALGTWQSVKFEGYAGLGFGATADYPTLALDKNAVYVGTNNFAPASAGGSNSFRGTTLNVIPLNSLFDAGLAAPTVANMKQFVTPYANGSGSNVDNGFALQGVNSTVAGNIGHVVAASLFNYDNLAFKVNGLTASSALGATKTASTLLGMAAYTSPSPGRQPDSVADTDVNLADTITNNKRVIDTLDERISSSAYEYNGKIYMVNAVDSGSDYTHVRYTVIDADTSAIVQEGDLGTGLFDYYQGSIAVSSTGRAVIGYNRSGNQIADGDGDGLADGNVTFMAQTFWIDAAGMLHATSGELKLKVSLVDDYHNGSVFGQVANGRQRWGDYSQVSIDPEDPNTFWAIGQFAREYNTAADGHPGGTGGSRWGTWIAEINAPVPEPSTYGMMAFGLVVVGGMAARRRCSS